MRTENTNIQETIQAYLKRQESDLNEIRERISNQKPAKSSTEKQQIQKLSTNPQKSFDDTLSNTLSSIFYDIVNCDSLESNFSLKKDVFDKVLGAFETESDELSTWFKENYSRLSGDGFTFNHEFEKLSAVLLSNEVSAYQSIHNNFPNNYYCLDSNLVKNVYIQTTDHPTNWNSWIPDELDYT